MRKLKGYTYPSHYENEEGKITVWVSNDDGHFVHPDIHTECDLKNAPFDMSRVVESTEGHDTNGTEVFVQDIIMYPSGSTAVVSFNQKTLEYVAISMDGKYTWNLYNSLFFENAIVVGNTFEGVKK